MGLFDFFKKDEDPRDEKPKEKYWSLTTDEGEVSSPSWEQVTDAIDKVVSGDSTFVSLGHMNGENDIEVVQAVYGEESGTFHLEVLPPETSHDYGHIFINYDVYKEQMLDVFEEYYNNQKVSGFRNWRTRKL